MRRCRGRWCSAFPTRPPRPSADPVLATIRRCSVTCIWEFRRGRGSSLPTVPDCVQQATTGGEKGVWRAGGVALLHPAGNAVGAVPVRVAVLVQYYRLRHFFLLWLTWRNDGCSLLVVLDMTAYLAPASKRTFFPTFLAGNTHIFWLRCRSSFVEIVVDYVKSTSYR